MPKFHKGGPLQTESNASRPNNFSTLLGPTHCSISNDPVCTSWIGWRRWCRGRAYWWTWDFCETSVYFAIFGHEKYWGDSSWQIVVSVFGIGRSKSHFLHPKTAIFSDLGCKKGTLDAPIQKRIPLFVANYPQKWWYRHLFHKNIIFGHILKILYTAACTELCHQIHQICHWSWWFVTKSFGSPKLTIHEI